MPKIAAALLLSLALGAAFTAHAGTWSPDGTYAGYLGTAGRLYAPDLESRPEGAASCLLVLRATDGHARVVRVDSNADTTRVWPVPGRDPASAVADAMSDGAGGFYVTWLDYRMGPTHWGRVYAQRIAASGLVAPGWPASGLPVGLPDVQSDRPRIVRTIDGGAFVAWDEIFGGPVDVAVRAVSPFGVPRSPDPVVALLSNDPQRLAALAPHPFGGAVLALENTHNNDTDLYAQRLGPDGEHVWGDAGSILANAANWQGAPVLLPNDDGSVLFGWEDARASAWNNPRTDIYATRLTYGGVVAPGFATSGNLVCAGVGRNDVHLVTDGAGGAFVSSAAFGEARIDRLAANGTVDAGWTNFIALTALPGLANHSHPTDAITDGEGGLFFAWSSGQAAFVQRLTGGGTLHPSWPVEGRAFDGGQGGIGRVSLAAGGASGSAWLSYESNLWLPCSPGEICYEKRAWAVRVPEAQAVDVPALSGGLSLAGMRPNPMVAGRSASIAFELPRAAPVRLEIVDVAGRVRFARRWTELSAGPHAIALAETAQLAPGVYLLRIEQDDQVATGRMILVRQ